jgi:hypothetical protein
VHSDSLILLRQHLQIERRKAERQRATQIQKLSPLEQKLQLAKELRTAHQWAKDAKASGNSENQCCAGTVIRQIKQEITACGFRESEIQELIAAEAQDSAEVSSKASDSCRQQATGAQIRELADPSRKVTDSSLPSRETSGPLDVPQGPDFLRSSMAEELGVNEECRECQGEEALNGQFSEGDRSGLDVSGGRSSPEATTAEKVLTASSRIQGNEGELDAVSSGNEKHSSTGERPTLGVVGASNENGPHGNQASGDSDDSTAFDLNALWCGLPSFARMLVCSLFVFACLPFLYLR